MAIPVTGLILSGGGARAAYQVGVLEAIAKIRRECGQGDGPNPFPVIAGTSAGAINAAALACRADDFDDAIACLVDVWRNFSADQVYRADSFGVIGTGARWLAMASIGRAIARWRRARPRSLLDNSPLQALLGRMISTERVQQMKREGHLKGLAVTASGYGSGLHVTFYDTVNHFVPWTRSLRVAVRTEVTVPHLLASSAIPFAFPAVELDIDGHSEYCGDGSMRQAAPISPAVHMGAERVLVVGAGRIHGPPEKRSGRSDYPNLAQIAGHALSSIFLDALAVDVERLQRINSTLALLTPQARAATTLRPIEVLVISPSQRLDDIAARHLGELPLPIRTMLRAMGVEARGDGSRGAALASYLLFEAPYTRELMALGMADTLRRRDAVIAFFGWETSTQQVDAGRVARAVPTAPASPSVLASA